MESTHDIHEENIVDDLDIVPGTVKHGDIVDDNDVVADPMEYDDAGYEDALRDDQSIDDYFGDLMQRVEISAEQLRREETKSTQMPPMVTAEVVTQAAAPVGSENETWTLPHARSPIPESSKQLLAMRNLAVSSAQAAIATSDDKFAERSYTDLMAATVSLFLSIVLLIVSGGTISGIYWFALALSAVSMFFGLRFLSRVRILGSLQRSDGDGQR